MKKIEALDRKMVHMPKHYVEKIDFKVFIKVLLNEK